MTRLAVVLTLVVMTTGGSMADDKTEARSKHPIYGLNMKSLTGKTLDLKDFEGKVLLIVNTASRCGATPQYDPLQGLHEKYEKAGLAVMGFPCNQFGRQEPGTNEDIATFCKKNYGVDFAMFSKIDVNGDEAARLYQFLTSEKSGLKDTGRVKWNFEKFLVSRDGDVVARFRTKVKPDSEDVVEAIEAELEKKAKK